MPAFLITVLPHTGASAAYLYLLDGTLDSAAAHHLAAILCDPVTQVVSVNDLAARADSPLPDLSVEVAFRPGVTDNAAESVRVAASRIGVTGVETVKTLRRYPLTNADAARRHFNPLIETAHIAATHDDAAARYAWYTTLLAPPALRPPLITTLPLRAADDTQLAEISRAGLLALDLAEMQTVQRYFAELGRDPTEGELETIAQTWSEHCSHKTFKARVRYTNPDSALTPVDAAIYPGLALLESAPTVEIESLIKTFLITATETVLAARPAAVAPWVLSAFVDNAGIIAFGEDYELSIKVETHNHPSALEPFGGANTGVGGVVRDVLGVSAQPIANIDVLCFGHEDTPDAALAPNVLPPRVTAAGVVAGVRDYGNKLGIPTVAGAVLYDAGYTANPLVYCGTVGLAPRGSHPRGAQAGDAIVALGGRTGRDGIHGATFSSIELTHTTAQEAGSAVQIGDPITEKTMIDVVLQARDARLYRAITDCGAGGFSSAVGEMGEETGAHVRLETIPLKYAGLQPWEIWLSEAQERMVLAVPPEHVAALLALCAAEDVEATVIGHFTDDQRLLVTYHNQTLAQLDMAFLHGGRPPRVMEAIVPDSQSRSPRPPAGEGPGERAVAAGPAGEGPGERVAETLLALLAHPNIRSRAPIIRSYDHEVGGRTVTKPLVGARADGPGDGVVLQPVPTDVRGVALGCGINPRYGMHDAYWMALACVDEALRNVVAAGGDPQRTVILDNFCWGSPRRPEQMAALTRAAAGCHDAAIAYGAPFVSGKDSLSNEYVAADGARTPIPATLLITALAEVPDVRGALTSDLKEAGNALLVVGLTKDELLGSHVADVGTLPAGTDLPRVDLASAPALMAALHQAMQAGLVRSCHDMSEGGLAVALAEMAIGGDCGATLDLSAVPAAAGLDAFALLFSESPTRFVVEARPAHVAALLACCSGLPCAIVGRVTGEPFLVIDGGGLADTPIRLSTEELRQAWGASRN